MRFGHAFEFVFRTILYYLDSVQLTLFLGGNSVVWRWDLLVSVNGSHEHHHQLRRLGLRLTNWEFPPHLRINFVTLSLGRVRLVKPATLQAVKKIESGLANIRFRQLFFLLLLSLFLLKLYILGQGFLHSFNHLRLLLFKLAQFIFLDLNHLFLRKHFLCDILLIAKFSQLRVQKLALFQLVPVLADGFCFLKVPSHF